MNLRKLLRWKPEHPVTVKNGVRVMHDFKIIWIPLISLQGLKSETIRAMGEMVFKPLTRTDVALIEVIANLNGQGPHTDQEIDYVANQLLNITAPSHLLEYSTDQLKELFGGAYHAQALQFEGDVYTCLLVRDPVGSYIYRWPAADTKKSRSVKVCEEKKSGLLEP